MIIVFYSSGVKKKHRTTEALDLTVKLIFVFLNFQIYPDPESEKAIMGSLVFCIHHKQGCKWSDELRKLKVRTEFNSAKSLFFSFSILIVIDAIRELIFLSAISGHLINTYNCFFCCVNCEHANNILFFHLLL